MSRDCPTPHRCPHCRCEWSEYNEQGTINRDAPFFPLVEELDALSLVHKNKAPRGRFGPNRSGAGAASTARPPARPNQEVRQ